MDVVAGAAGVGRVQQQQKAQHRPQRRGQSMLLSQLPQRDHRCGQHRRLQNLKRRRSGRQPVKGQQQITDGRNMYGEMAQRAVPLHGGDGQSLRFHGVEHLRKDGKIKGGRGKAVYPAYRPQTYQREKRDSPRGSQPFPACLFRARHGLGRTRTVPAPQGIDQEHAQNQHPRGQKRPCKAGAQRNRCQRARPGKQHPALRPQRQHPGNGAEQNKNGSRRQRHTRQRHLGDAIQPFQPACGTGKQQIFRRRGNHPCQNRFAENVRKGKSHSFFSFIGYVHRPFLLPPYSTTKPAGNQHTADYHPSRRGKAQIASCFLSETRL